MEEHRRVLAEGRSALERTSASLARSSQIAIETEHVGTEVNYKFVIDKSPKYCQIQGVTGERVLIKHDFYFSIRSLMSSGSNVNPCYEVNVACKIPTTDCPSPEFF